MQDWMSMDAVYYFFYREILSILSSSNKQKQTFVVGCMFSSCPGNLMDVSLLVFRNEDHMEP